MISEKIDITVIQLWSLFVSKNIYTFDSCLNNDEDIFDFKIHGCIFDDNLVNFDQPDDIMEIMDNSQTIESTDTLSYKSFSSICN